ncbi:unnamed protein product [Mytilus edulis]|uniref:C2H2-type domain-containing protein n=1 Tax=Mytilus edulis TaxID=6550 RepID=A0A8S3U2H4_MYTED|nr:unnamed protein product [Mytilus edulis]
MVDATLCENSGCTNCSKTPWGAMCVCEPGQILSSDNKTCKDEVVLYDEQESSGEVQSKCCGKGTCKEIPAIGSYSNFSFEEGGIRVWKDHGIGEGLLIKNDQIPAINIRYITVLKEPDDIPFHQLPKRNTKPDTENLVIQCTNDGCTEEFSTERELLNHQLVGKCQIEIEFNSGLNSDITKKKYYEKLSESSFLKGVLNLSAETKQMVGLENSLRLGWALKTERKSKHFN